MKITITLVEMDHNQGLPIFVEWTRGANSGSFPCAIEHIGKFVQKTANDLITVSVTSNGGVVPSSFDDEKLFNQE